MPASRRHSDAPGAQDARNATLAARTGPKQSERHFQEQVVLYAHLMSWGAYHTWNSKHSAAGFPDLVLVRRPRVVFAELKREGEKPTAAQQSWIDELRACGQECYVWTPADWDEIRAALEHGED